MKNKEVSIDTFSVLNATGWAMVIMRLANIISTPWEAIANYWLCLATISVTLYIATAIIGCAIKVGGHSAK
ncbi:hypothetical protein FEZ34_13535 [Lacticaseibacillus casei]|uniref:hypothetical protein n=1 Tax=Lacticaseibacillus casei TaxID=1582 RepID=UPI001108EC04|nr:hypothetical protein [Lacticaseibacillus casei]TLQ49782.1 hypothetical protein FEZ34_13535 [Lacticaseibacillus casei]